MIRTTRAALAAAAPSAALALAVVFASAALAPEAAPAPEPTASAEAVVVATPSPAPDAVVATPRAGDRDDRGRSAGILDGDAAAICCGTALRGTAAEESVEPVEGGAGWGDSGESGGEAPSPAPSPEETTGVDVGVAIDPVVGPGSLSMTVQSASARLGESGSTQAHRRFVGALPTVTVTDTRDPASSAGWFVLASAGDFEGASGQPAIGADHLGWTPALLGGDASAVRAGQRVAGGLDGGEGIRDAVLLATVDGSSAGADSWSATAELVLGTERSVAPGAYRSTLTLSLFE